MSMTYGALATVDRRTILAAATKVKPLPVSVEVLAVLVNVPSVEMKDVVEVITFDAALTAAVLRSANSVVSGPARPIVTVREAVVRIGLASTLAFAMANSIGNDMRRSIDCYELDGDDLWIHSVTTMLAAEEIRARVPTLPPGVVTAALLHDFGKLVMDEALDERNTKLMVQERRGWDGSEIDLERSLFGVDHAQVGGAVAAHWALPEILVEGMRFHHTPVGALSAAAPVVAVADLVADTIREREHTKPEDVQPVDLDPLDSLFERLCLDSTEFEEIVTVTSDKFAQVAPRFLS
jgi:HD-like signal output (HDOD) protein